MQRPERHSAAVQAGVIVFTTRTDRFRRRIWSKNLDRDLKITVDSSFTIEEIRQGMFYSLPPKIVDKGTEESRYRVVDTYVVRSKLEKATSHPQGKDGQSPSLLIGRGTPTENTYFIKP
ncbi:hypothetical protein AVEN_7446-1 [Araneus ventricosus]|uniref:Uncharacterized protein n=1 Tax=Araneus ventricosus TaxID=182803 RepID=A0A4Y2I3P7_ARAVE|nr:hypothetical protein AVEN_7446-1 [Araneus ventricosus]